jgi:hypothetical protein
VKGHVLTPAEETVVLLQDAARGGVPVLIPGAREVSRDPPADSLRGATHIPAIFHAPQDIGNTRERLQYQFEGGGAKSQRWGASHGPPFVRFRKWTAGLFRRKVQ